MSNRCQRKFNDKEIISHLRSLLSQLHFSTYKCTSCGCVDHIEKKWECCYECGEYLCNECHIVVNGDFYCHDCREHIYKCVGCDNDIPSNEEITCINCGDYICLSCTKIINNRSYCDYCHHKEETR